MASVPGMPSSMDLDDDVELLAPEEEMVPEHDLHRVLVDLLAAGLTARFAGREDVAVFSRLAWFPDRSDTRIRLNPDVMVVRGRPPGPRKSYKAWQEDGIAPAVLVEVWSDDDTDADYRRRLNRALAYGVEEVVIVDPFAVGGVRVEHLRADGDRFRSVASTAHADRLVVVESLGVSMAGGDELQVISDGARWPTTAEAFQLARSEAVRADREAARAVTEHVRAETERERAETERERAEAERERAEAERERADRLAAMLRDAGIDAGEGPPPAG
jgi:Uma2 family endonuclease